MRLFTLLLAFVSLSLAFAQTDSSRTQGDASQRIPATLAEAHEDLERTLPAEELARIDAMTSESEMIRYHLGLGMSIRNAWGLWTGSPLSKHLQQLGFTHPDDMSGVILETFWCKRHGKEFRLEERAAKYAAFWKAAADFQKREMERVEKARSAIQSMMMGLRLEKRDVPVVRMPDRRLLDAAPIRARYLAPYRDGVFVAAIKSTGPNDNDFVTEGYYFDPADRQLHKIGVAGVTEVHSVVVAGETAWFAGLTGGKPILVSVKERARSTLALPRGDKPPLLGLHGQELLAVYSDAVFRYAGGRWERLYSGSLPSRKPGPPPRLHGDLLYLRDEGTGGSSKRLWWVDIANRFTPVSLDRDVKVVGPNGPRWETTASYVVTDKGDLWACLGDSGGPTSILRRSKDGTYAVAIFNNAVDFAPDLLGTRMNQQGLSLCAMTLHPDGSIVLVGNSGIYRFHGSELSHELEFANTSQAIAIDRQERVFRWRWTPVNVIMLPGSSYFITDAFDGFYLLAKADGKTWAFESLDEKMGEPVLW